MFQFTDDDDPDVEGLFDLPLDKCTGKGELNATKCSQADNLKDILDDFDDNDLIFSAIDNVDNSSIDQSVLGKSSNKSNSESVDNIANCHRTPPKNPCLSSNEKHIKTNNVKHKLTLIESCTSTTKAPRVEYERKFPGPAGLIPKKSNTTTPVKYQVFPDGSPKQIDVLPNKNDFIFENSCWNQLIKDIETISPKLLSIIDENTVASVRRLNIICSKPRKLQFFAAQIVSIDGSARDPSVVLKDSTGEIHGTLHKELWETYEDFLTVGTVLLMKQVSVFNITNSRKLYVNVTSYNIVKIYTPRSGGPVLVTEVVKSSELDLSPVKKNERLVFEETHPNTTSKNPTKEVPIRKPFIPSVSKTDSVKTTQTRNENTPQKVELKTKTETLVYSTKSAQNEVHVDKLLGDIDVDSLFGENGRQVFKETHPNIPNYVKEPTSHKPSISFASKTDTFKAIRNENTPHQVELQIKTDTIHSVRTTDTIQTQNEMIFEELDGIDADSLFGEF